jgi:DNA repair protein RadA/Sms
MRAERIGALRPRLLLAAETDLATVLGHVEAVAPDLLVVDSVQTIASDAIEGSAGGVSQVREVAGSLIKAAKQRGMATLLVGHVTKDGSVAGPRVLEHLVDVVCQFEGDRHSPLRMVRAVKNRYGPTDEVGCFELSESGIEGLADPSGLFMSRHLTPVAGTAVTVTLEGRRPLVSEVQGLVAPPTGPTRRATSGLDNQRLALVLAVLERHCEIPMSKHDVYAATVGGVRLAEPASDLALALAITSTARNAAVVPGLVAIGEVGLAGEIRPVSSMRGRLAEAARLGFTTALVPPRCAIDSVPIRAVEVADIRDAAQRAIPPY